MRWNQLLLQGIAFAASGDGGISVFDLQILLDRPQARLQIRWRDKHVMSQEVMQSANYYAFTSCESALVL